MSNFPCSTTGQLISALAGAVAGDTITLTAGNTFDIVSTLALRNHGGTSPIIIQSSALANLQEGKRVSPGSVASMPLLRSTANNTSIFASALSAGWWTLQGLALTSTVVRQESGLIDLNGDAANVSESQLPHDIEIARCYLYGLPWTDVTYGNLRGIRADVVNFVLRDSHLSEFKHPGSDSQALYVQTGRNHLIQNNYLEAAGENVMYGGGVTFIDGYVSSDIEIRNNHFFKPPEWNRYHPRFGDRVGGAAESAGPSTITCVGTACTSTGHGAYAYQSVRINSTGEHRRITVGHPDVDANAFTIEAPFSTNPTGAAWTKLHGWSVKNLLEFKMGERIKVEGNLFEGNWPQGQDGRAILFTPRSSSLNTGHNPWARTQDIVVRHNWVRNVTSVFNIMGYDNDSATPGDASNRTVQTPGPGLISTVGANATFSGTANHGLVAGDIVRLTSGPRDDNARTVIATPTATTATLIQEFRTVGGTPVPQTNQSWEKWSVLVPTKNILIEHNVMEHIGKGEANGYYDPASGATKLFALITLSPSNLIFRHNTLIASDEAEGSEIFLGSVGNVITNFTTQDNIMSNCAYPFHGDSLNGNAAIAAYTTGDVVINHNVFYGTLADSSYGPANNAWPTNVATVGFDSLTDRRLHLTSGTYRAGQVDDASDGTDRGANVLLVQRMVRGRHGLGQGW